MVRAAEASGQTTMVDFNFGEILSWVKAKTLFDEERSAASATLKSTGMSRTTARACG